MSRIMQVMRNSGINYVERGNGIFMPCPCCQEPDVNARDFKIKIYDDTENGGFNCIKCGARGNFVHLDYLIKNGSMMPDSIYSEYSKQVLKDLGEWKEYKPTPIKAAKKKEEESIANIFARNAFYEKMFRALSLFPWHREHLRHRGLSDEQIDRNEYVSVPRFLSTRTREILFPDNCNCTGIPGTYRDKKRKWNLRLDNPSGIMIPVRDIKGRIEGCQIRLEKPIGKTKYIYLSTNNCTEGTKALTWIHSTPGVKESKDVILTEGALKADVIFALSGIPVVSVLGVTSTKFLPAFVKDNLVGKTVHIAFDMDSFKNSNVHKAEEALFDLFEENKVSYRRLIWDERKKGLDDYLACPY